MALPSSGSITIAQIATELGLSLPLDLTDSRVRALAGKPSGSITMPNDLWGKSSVTISIVGNMSAVRGGGRDSLYDQGTFSVSKSGGGSITAYSWNVWNDSHGRLYVVDGSLTGASVTLASTSTYNEFEFTETANAQVGCTVTVDGRSIYTERTLTYQVGSF